MTSVPQQHQQHHEQIRRAIRAHFAGAGAPPRERAMRAHLPGCADCRAYYERWLLAARLDPAAPSDQDRMARGLGLAVGRAPGGGLRRLVALAGVAAAAAVLLLVIRPGPRDGGRGFVSRGGSEVTGPAAELEIYRLAAGGGAPEPVAGTLHAGDELAFAYRNPTGKRRVLVFAVDEHGHVFWYHPGWAEPRDNPVAVAVSTEPGLHELPAAIAQRYVGQRLVVHALFTDQELTVRQVESALASGAGHQRSGKEEWEWPFSDTTDVIRAIQVVP